MHIFEKSSLPLATHFFLSLVEDFAFYGVSDTSYSSSAKIGASLLSPTCFSLLIALIATLEDNGVGANGRNTSAYLDNYSVGAGIGSTLQSSVRAF